MHHGYILYLRHRSKDERRGREEADTGFIVEE